jgi:hypothetical protein
MSACPQRRSFGVLRGEALGEQAANGLLPYCYRTASDWTERGDMDQ